MCSIINQSAARKFDQSEVTISSRLSNQIAGKQTNDRAGDQWQHQETNEHHRYKVFNLENLRSDQITKQSPARKSDQWDDRIQYLSTNQKPGKRTNQKRGDFNNVRVRTICTVTESSLAFWIFWQTMTMFTCERCGKEYTEKRSLLRHMKTHVDSSQIYSCSICDKEFSRADTRKRHEATHGKRTTFNSICRLTREEWIKHHKPDQRKPPRGNCHLQLDPAQRSDLPCHHHQRPPKTHQEKNQVAPIDAESFFQTFSYETKAWFV